MATSVNRKWASGIGADGQPVYAPRYAIEVNGRRVYNPKDKHYRMAGYQSVVEAPPSVPAQEGCIRHQFQSSKTCLEMDGTWFCLKITHTQYLTKVFFSSVIQKKENEQRASLVYL